MEGRDEKGRFVPGHSGFKPKGSRTAITKRHLDTIAKHIAETDKDVPQRLYELLENPNTSPDLQFKILSKLMDYSDDKTFLEEQDNGNDLRVDRTELLGLLKQELEGTENS